MNVLNSLKALLFASSGGAIKGPIKGAGSGATPAGGAPDFAQLLGAVEGQKAGQATVAVPAVPATPATTDAPAAATAPVVPVLADGVKPVRDPSPAVALEPLPKEVVAPDVQESGDTPVADATTANTPAPPRVAVASKDAAGAGTGATGVARAGRAEVTAGTETPAEIAPDDHEVEQADKPTDDDAPQLVEGSAVIPPPVIAQPVAAAAATPVTVPVAAAVTTPVSGDKAQAQEAGAVVPDSASAIASPDGQAAIGTPGDPVPIPAIMAQADGTKAPVVRGEALSLLQLFQDHMKGRTMRSDDHAAPAAAAASSDAASPADIIIPALTRTDAPAPVASSAPTLTPQTAIAATPTVDLSASLGAQVVDMGVSGQWIDGLARDIAGLSANGAQGRFQINADTLGPIQVDIRQGEAGASVSLTVATDMAEQALRQDSDRLRLDAGLAAVRISDVKVERAPVVTDAARSDATGQNGAQSQHQGQSSGQAQGQGQAMGQSSSQGRWQSRENIASSHKAGQDTVVLNHADTGESPRDAVRARYA